MFISKSREGGHAMDAIVLVLQAEAFISQFGYLTVILTIVTCIIIYILWRVMETSLKNNFEEKFLKVKTEQDDFLKKAQYEIDKRFDRAVNYHKIEYEILPEAWSKIKEAYNYVDHIITNYIHCPDLNRLNDQEVEDFLAREDLNSAEKHEILNSRNKHDKYIEIVTWNRLIQSREICRNAKIYIEKNSIFMNSDIEHLFLECMEFAWEACNEKIVERQMRGKILNDNYKESGAYQFHTNGTKALDKLRNSLRERLYN